MAALVIHKYCESILSVLPSEVMDIVMVWLQMCQWVMDGVFVCQCKCPLEAGHDEKEMAMRMPLKY